MGTLTNKPNKAYNQSTINLSVIMTQHYPQKFANLHMVDAVVNSTNNLFAQEFDHKHEPNNGHVKHKAV